LVDTSCNVAWGGQQCELKLNHKKEKYLQNPGACVTQQGSGCFFALLQVKLPVQKGQKSAQAIGEVLCQTAADLDAAVMIIASHGT